MLGSRRGCLPVILAGVMLAAVLSWFLGGWYLAGPLARQTAFIVPDGSSLSGIADKLESSGAISSARAFPA